MIDRERVIRFINAYAGSRLNLDAVTGTPYQKTLHLRLGDKTDDYRIIEAGLNGEGQALPENLEITGRQGSFPVSGMIIPLKNGESVTALAFIFKDDSEQAAKIKEQEAFFSAAAHELRTPLTVIRMTVGLLRDKLDSMPHEKIIEHLRVTEESTTRLVKLVNDFLNISRLDQGRLEIHSESFDILAMTDEIISDVTLLAKERKLYINHEPGENIRKVFGDRDKAREVLANLISNAIKYTVQGGITITHQVYDSKLATKVTDTGPGISPEYQRMLFKRFQQVGNARSLSPAKSSGLGLYIAKKFAQLMNGDVVLEKSEPGVGSTFTFTLPLG